MSITLSQAKSLTYHTELHHCINRNADGTPQRWRVNGKPKTWKTRPNDVRIPIKHGLYAFDYLTQNNLNLVCLTAIEAITL